MKWPKGEQPTVTDPGSYCCLVYFRPNKDLPPFCPRDPPPQGYRLGLCTGWVTCRRVKNAFWSLYRFGEHPDLLMGDYAPALLIAVIGGFLPAIQRREMLSYRYSATLCKRAEKMAHAMLRTDNHNDPERPPIPGTRHRSGHRRGGLGQR